MKDLECPNGSGSRIPVNGGLYDEFSNNRP